MAERVRHLTFTLDDDIREDDLPAIVSAIEHVRGVSSVESHVVTDSERLARRVVRAEVQRRLHEAVEGVFRQHELRERVKER